MLPWKLRQLSEKTMTHMSNCRDTTSTNSSLQRCLDSGIIRAQFPQFQFFSRTPFAVPAPAKALPATGGGGGSGACGGTRGFGGAAGTFVGIAKILFFIALAVFVVFLVLGILAGKGVKDAID